MSRKAPNTNTLDVTKKAVYPVPEVSKEFAESPDFDKEDYDFPQDKPAPVTQDQPLEVKVVDKKAK